MQTPRACLIVIGNEILSGRTQDRNIAWLGVRLNEIGIRLAEVRIIPDMEETIVEAVNACRPRFDYVFTTGGIGPTHDDITAAAIAKAFGLPFERHAEADAVLKKHYGERLNDARLSMADMPRGSTLIANPVSIAPGFSVENVYVLAGVPSVMQAMFASLKGSLKGGAPMLSRTISAFVTEGALAERLEDIQNHHPDVEIGSYPFFREKLGTSLVARSTDEAALEAAYREMKELVLRFTDTVEEG